MRKENKLYRKRKNLRGNSASYKFKPADLIQKSE